VITTGPNKPISSSLINGSAHKKQSPASAFGNRDSSNQASLKNMHKNINNSVIIEGDNKKKTSNQKWTSSKVGQLMNNLSIDD